MSETAEIVYDACKKRGHGHPGMGEGLPGTVGDYGAQLGRISDMTARVISYDVKRICFEVYDFSLASTGGPSAGTTVPYSPSGPHLPGRSLSWPPQKGGL